jgi:hypothetical protein
LTLVITDIITNRGQLERQHPMGTDHTEVNDIRATESPNPELPPYGGYHAYHIPPYNPELTEAGRNTGGLVHASLLALSLYVPYLQGEIDYKDSNLLEEWNAELFESCVLHARDAILVLDL